MSIYGAMFSGVSGLSAQSQALAMISDNISNVNTVAYKGSSARFHTLVTDAASATQYSPGGVRSSPYQKVDKQGLLQGSSSATDLAIIGSGFFVVADAADAGIGKTFMFTRAGNFGADSGGRLVTSSGYYLQGWRLDPDGELPASTSLLEDLETITVSATTGSAQPTSSIDVGLNLPSQAATADTFETTVQLYDKQGATQSIRVVWEKTGSNAWSLSGILPGSASFADDDTGTATLDNGQGTPVPLGTLTFNSNGTLASVAASGYGTLNADGGISFYVDYDGSAATTSTDDRQEISLSLGTIGQGDGVTQYASEFFTSQIDQNGRGIGAFAGVRITEEGIVTALYDNGQQRNIFKLPIAMFRNPNGLEGVNGNAYRTSGRSGDPVLAEANTGGAGVVSPSSLEASNVDLAEEFTNMIITQRAYSANAKVITTADEMLEELIRAV
jgi:flagellar hook protein FlgE